MILTFTFPRFYLKAFKLLDRCRSYAAQSYLVSKPSRALVTDYKRIELLPAPESSPWSFGYPDSIHSSIAILLLSNWLSQLKVWEERVKVSDADLLASSMSCATGVTGQSQSLSRPARILGIMVHILHDARDDTNQSRNSDNTRDVACSRD
jgi:hypothetical protein